MVHITKEELTIPNLFLARTTVGKALAEKVKGKKGNEFFIHFK